MSLTARRHRSALAIRKEPVQLLITSQPHIVGATQSCKVNEVDVQIGGHDREYRRAVGETCESRFDRRRKS
jgi:hypothetical protein